MPDIQHRDIPDSGLHEIKGAATALVGSIPVADGVGGTSFQKLGVGSLTGSIPTSIPDVVVVTDGTGGFKAATKIYAYMRRELRVSPPPIVETLTNLVTPQGVFINAASFQVQSTGYYQVSIMRTVTLPSELPDNPVVYSPTDMYRRDLGSVVGTGGTFIVQLFAGVDYGVNGDCTFTILGL